MPLILRLTQGAVSINGELFNTLKTDQELPEDALVDTLESAAFTLRSQTHEANHYAEVKGSDSWKVKLTSAISTANPQVYSNDRQPILFFHSHCCGCDRFYELQTQDGSVRIGMK